MEMTALPMKTNRAKVPPEVPDGAQPDEAASDISDYQNFGKNTNYHEDKNQRAISVLGKPSDYCIPEIDFILTEDEASQDGDDGSKYQHFIE